MPAQGSSSEAEAQLQQQVANRLLAVVLGVVPSVSALLTLLLRCLSGGMCFQGPVAVYAMLMLGGCCQEAVSRLIACQACFLYPAVR